LCRLDVAFLGRSHRHFLCHHRVYASPRRTPRSLLRVFILCHEETVLFCATIDVTLYHHPVAAVVNHKRGRMTVGFSVSLSRIIIIIITLLSHLFHCHYVVFSFYYIVVSGGRLPFIIIIIILTIAKYSPLLFVYIYKTHQRFIFMII
jgi:hypothetical protein